MKIEKGYTERSQFLKDFLVKHNAFEKFIKAMDDYNGAVSFNDIANRNEDAITEAFSWCTSKDGFTFWFELDSLYVNEYNNYFWRHDER